MRSWQVRWVRDEDGGCVEIDGGWVSFHAIGAFRIDLEMYSSIFHTNTLTSFSRRPVTRRAALALIVVEEFVNERSGAKLWDESAGELHVPALPVLLKRNCLLLLLRNR
jgi:hypothetical protein